MSSTRFPSSDNNTTVDGRVYAGRSPVNLPNLVGILGAFSASIAKGGLRKDLRHFAGAIGFAHPSSDELNRANEVIANAKKAKNAWYNALTETERNALGDAMIAQGATEKTLAIVANRGPIGIDSAFALLDVSKDAASKITTLDSMNKVTGNKLNVETISDRNVKSALESMSPATAFQLVQSKHWGKLEKNVRELCLQVGTTIERCIYSKATGMPGASEKAHFVGSINPGRVAAEPVLN